MVTSLTDLPYSDSLTDFSEVIALIDSQDHEDGILALDTEGTDINQDYRDGRGYATCISLCARVGGLQTAYLNFRRSGEQLEPEQKAEIRYRLENFKGWLIIHNAKHDLVALRTLGINYTGKFYCTLQMCHYINEVVPYMKSLENCVRHYVDKNFGKVKDDGFEAMCKVLGWDKVPAQYMDPYARGDAILHLLLWETIKARFDREITPEYWAYRQDFTRCIINMERRGVRIDVARCNRMAAIGELQMDDIVQQLGLNPGSPKDLQKLLIDKLGLPVVKRSKKTNAPSFDKSAMEQYEEILEHRNDTTAELILTYRGWQKAVSSNYKAYVELLSPDGRLRTNYKLHGTKTGRMSSERPNLQNIPRSGAKAWNGEMKLCMVPEDDYGLWEFDYSQLELRLAAAYGQEKGLIEIFADPDRDIFSEMSEQLGFERFTTKTLTYTIQFGGGVTRLMNVFNVSEERAAKIKNTWFATYKGIKKCMDLAASEVRRTGKVQLWTKRYRHFFYGSDEAHKAFNAVIQGGAADIVGRQMVRLHQELDNDAECRMLLQVHDSVWFEIKHGCEDKYLPEIKRIMEDITPDFGVRFTVDMKKLSKESV